MHGPLDLLLADGVIEEPCRRLKSGKEADLWLVGAGGELVAAKVYKARETRSFKNNAGYKEGRQVRNTRTQRAMDRGSRFGQAAAEEAWKAKEADALHTLHAAGVRVPRPVLFHEGVLLMELVVDANGHPAPRLSDVDVGQEDAGALYQDLRAQVVRMLCCDIIHGDLSPYNVLLGQDGAVVIDFPQVVGAAHNSQAESFLRRDLENLRHYFAAIDPSLRANENDAREIWRAYTRRELTPDFVPSGRMPPAAPQKARPHGEQRSRPGGEQHPAAPHGQPQRSRRQDEQRSRPHGEQHPAAPHREAQRPRPQVEQRSAPRGEQHPAPAHREPQRSRQGEQRPPPRGEQHPAAPHREAQRSRPQDEQRARTHGEPHRTGPRGEPQRSRPQGEQRSRPHEGVAREPARPERGPLPPRGRPQEPAGGARGQRGLAPVRRDPAGRAQDRRRSSPAPEVIRVVRPPLAPRGASAPAQHPPRPAAPHAAAASATGAAHAAVHAQAHGAPDSAGEGRSRRRRRRRR